MSSSFVDSVNCSMDDSSDEWWIYLSFLKNNIFFWFPTFVAFICLPYCWIFFFPNVLFSAFLFFSVLFLIELLCSKLVALGACLEIFLLATGAYYIILPNQKICKFVNSFRISNCIIGHDKTFGFYFCKVLALWIYI